MIIRRDCGIAAVPRWLVASKSDYDAILAAKSNPDNLVSLCTLGWYSWSQASDEATHLDEADAAAWIAVLEDEQQMPGVKWSYEAIPNARGLEWASSFTG